MLIKTDPDQLQSYLEDSSSLSGGRAEAAYFPETEEEIIQAIKACRQKNIPLTISAGKTGTTGGCIPFGGAVLSTERLNKIIKTDPKDKFAVLQPGVTLAELNKPLSAKKLLYPPDPTEQTCFIGGNVATNASGARTFRFGPTRDYVRRLRIVLMDGEILEITRGKTLADAAGFLNFKSLSGKSYVVKIPSYQMPKVKNAAGYYSKPGMDLIDLFIGSEGTLGIFSEIEIQLIDDFENIFSILAFFEEDEAALNFAEEAKKTSPLCLEYFDQNSLELLRPKYSQMPPAAWAAVFFEQNYKTGEDIVTLWSNLLEKYGVNLDNCWSADNPQQRKTIEDFRHALPEILNDFFKRTAQLKLSVDIAVPDQNFPEMLQFYRSTLEGSGLKYVIFGHIGNNHLHVNLLPKNESESIAAKEKIILFVKKAVAFGGTVSAEHGIGKIKHVYLKEMYGEEGIEGMRRVKRALDPNFLLNRGNIF